MTALVFLAATAARQGVFPTCRTTDKCCFSGICRPQQDTSGFGIRSCCGGRPRHRRPSALGEGGLRPPSPPCSRYPNAPINSNLKYRPNHYNPISRKTEKSRLHTEAALFNVKFQTYLSESKTSADHSSSTKRMPFLSVSTR